MGVPQSRLGAPHPAITDALWRETPSELIVTLASALGNWKATKAKQNHAITRNFTSC